MLVQPTDVMKLLGESGIQPSPQRVAVASFVLSTDAHPSAEQVLSKVRATFPMVSRATVYNTLNVLVQRGLLRELVLSEGSVVFDPNTEPHHHFVDDATGAICDVPWEALKVSNVRSLASEGFDVREYQVVLRGKRATPPRRP